MNWREVRRHNAIRSQQKARREAYAAERKRKIEQAGGPITVAELRGATRRLEPSSKFCPYDREVWTFRGRDWVLGYSDGIQWWSFAPYAEWRVTPDGRECVTMTAAARKWLNATLATECEE